MISCPAANGMRWVNPSSATRSPKRTKRETTSDKEVSSVIVKRCTHIALGEARHRSSRAHKILQFRELTAMVEGIRTVSPMQHRRHPPRETLCTPYPLKRAIGVRVQEVFAPRAIVL